MLEGSEKVMVEAWHLSSLFAWKTKIVIIGREKLYALRRTLTTSSYKEMNNLIDYSLSSNKKKKKKKKTLTTYLGDLYINTKIAHNLIMDLQIWFHFEKYILINFQSFILVWYYKLVSQKESSYHYIMDSLICKKNKIE